MDVLGNGPSEELLMQWRVYRISWRGPNFCWPHKGGLTCFPVFLRWNKNKNTKLFLLTKGAPFFRRVGGPGCNRTPAPWASPPLGWPVEKNRTALWPERLSQRQPYFSPTWLQSNLTSVQPELSPTWTQVQPDLSPNWPQSNLTSVLLELSSTWTQSKLASDQVQHSIQVKSSCIWYKSARVLLTCQLWWQSWKICWVMRD